MKNDKLSRSQFNPIIRGMFNSEKIKEILFKVIMIEAILLGMYGNYKKFSRLIKNLGLIKILSYSFSNKFYSQFLY